MRNGYVEPDTFGVTIVLATLANAIIGAMANAIIGLRITPEVDRR